MTIRACDKERPITGSLDVGVRRRLKAAVGSLIILFHLLPAGFASAQEGLKAGPLTLYPALRVSATYDSNIYLAGDHEEEDLITRIIPSLRILLPIRRFYLQAEGEAGIVRYMKNKDEDNDIYKLSAAVGADFPGGLRFIVADTFTRTYLNTRAEFDVAEYVYVNQLYGKVGYAIRDAFNVELEYFNYNFVYDETNDLDRNENTLAMTLYARVMPKTMLLFEAGFSDLSYTDDAFSEKDNQMYQLRGGLKWAFTGRSTGELRLGANWKKYDSDVTLDTTNIVAAGQLTTAFSRYTFLDLELRRGTIESDYQLNPYYLTTRLLANLSRRITSKITGYVGMSLRYDQYPNETQEADQRAKRADGSWGLKAGIDFKMFRRLTVGASYGFEERYSNLDRFDFDDHRVELSAKVAF